MVTNATEADSGTGPIFPNSDCLGENTIQEISQNLLQVDLQNKRSASYKTQAHLLTRKSDLSLTVKNFVSINPETELSAHAYQFRQAQQWD